MPLKMLKVNINIDVKGDQNDEEDFKERVYETIQMLIESEELPYTVEEDEEEYEDEC